MSVLEIQINDTFNHTFRNDINNLKSILTQK